MSVTPATRDRQMRMLIRICNGEDRYRDDAGRVRLDGRTLMALFRAGWVQWTTPEGGPVGLTAAGRARLQRVALPVRSG